MKSSFIKRLVSSATSLVMITSCFTGTITTSAAQQTFTLVDGITATLDDNGVFTVTGKGDMPDTSTTTRPYQSEINNITSVVVSDGITSIGNFTFPNCSNLVKADITDNVQSIGVSAFADCTKAELVIDIKGTLNNVGNNAFGNVKGTINVYNQATYELVKPKATQATVNWIADTATLKQIITLQQCITDAEKHEQEDYTEESYKALSNAITHAEDVLKSDNTIADDIKKATKAIEEAIQGLVPTEKQPVIDCTELEKKIAKAEVYLSDEFKGNYTEESISALSGEVKEAEVLLLSNATTQQKVEDAVNAIKNSINSLVKKIIEPQILNNQQLLQPTTKSSQIIKEKIIKNRKGIKVKSKKRKITIKLNRKKKCKYLIKIFNNKNKNIAKNPVTQGSTSKKLVTTYKKIKKGKYLVQIYEVKANKAMNKISNVQCIYADYKKVK